MSRRRCVLVILVASFGAGSNLDADESPSLPDKVKAAISKAIPLLEKGTAGSADQRQCFTCHNQALPILALVEARKRGFGLDEPNLERQLRHTLDHLERGRENYLEGRGQGGKVITAGYALWALESGGQQPTDATAAVTRFLLEYQKDADHWTHPGNRPPSSGSEFTTSYVALRGLAGFGTSEQRPEIVARTKRVYDWLQSSSPLDTEDRVFRLWALVNVAAGEEFLKAAVSELVDRQRDDGGWAQADDMQSDAYATGTVLVVLLRTGSVCANHPAVRRGVDFLLRTQNDDGSWHVVSRAEPFQTYFETGFPHAKDQFISISASSWATLALLLSLETD